METTTILKKLIITSLTNFFFQQKKQLKKKLLNIKPVQQQTELFFMRVILYMIKATLLKKHL